jgi:hypothetical protein
VAGLADRDADDGRGEDAGESRDTTATAGGDR